MAKLLLIFVCLTVFAIGEACKCQEQLAKTSFCNAHWVAHTKINVRQTKQKMPEGSERKGLNNIRYTVTFPEVFKAPKDLNGKLPSEIYTPSEPPACGLLIEAGKEYLLAGRYENGIMTTVLCGQILQDDTTKPQFENVLEWQNVPNSLRNRLRIKAFEPC